MGYSLLVHRPSPLHRTYGAPQLPRRVRHVVADSRLSEPDVWVECVCGLLIRSTLENVERDYRRHVRESRQEARQGRSEPPGRDDRAEVA